MKVKQITLIQVCVPLSALALSLSLVACTSNSENTKTTQSEPPPATASADPCEITDQEYADDIDVDENRPEDLSVSPEIATGFRSGMAAVKTKTFAVATANPLASKAACETLRDGGSAADALVTAQFVLGLTEPQSSGVGGGGYILYYDAAKDSITALDGREVAPLAADENYLINISAEDSREPLPDARRSGRSIGVPGIVAALGELHENSGKMSWSNNLAPAQELATDGFNISPRMSASIADSAKDLSVDPEAAAYFLDAEGKAKKSGTLLKNPAYAETVKTLAENGADSFYTGDLAQAIVESATRQTDGLTPSLLSTADLAGYSPAVHEALCAPYRNKTVCSMPPSSSGGVAVLETLGILENTDISRLAPTDVGADGGLPSIDAIHLISEAERLAYADRDAYIGDPEFVQVPAGGVPELISPQYTQKRFDLIDPERSMQEAQPGLVESPVGATIPDNGTSHISIIDSQGNAASMTTTVESAFGSFHFTNGFILNNQLTDFSANPVNEQGQPVANRVQAAKRPRSSMAPVLVFGQQDNGQRGNLEMVLGSPGGSLIIQFVLKTLVSIIDWGMDPQQAVSAPNFGALNRPETAIGTEHPLVEAANDNLTQGLEQRGHKVNSSPQSSGLSALVVDPENGISGGADPRREGVVLGD